MELPLALRSQSAITSLTISGTGTMDAVAALCNMGYTVTVEKNGDSYKLSGSTSTDKETIMDLIPTTDGASTTLYVTIDNNMGSSVQYTVNVEINLDT